MLNARIEAISYYNGTKYEPKIEIGERTSFGQNLHMTCCKELTIGHDVKFSANIYITDVAQEDENVLTQPLIEKPTHIGDYCFIGYGAPVSHSENSAWSAATQLFWRGIILVTRF